MDGLGLPTGGDVEALTASDLLDGLPQRIHEICDVFVERTPDHPAFVAPDRTWTYAQFSQAVDEVVHDLRQLGVRPGDRILLASENCVEVGAFVFAASKLDAWAIVANPRLSAREIDQIYEHSGARRRFFTTRVSPEAAQHASRVGAEIGRVGPFADIGVGALNADATAEPVEASGARQVAVLIYTSGTTGAPKGVMLSHENLLFSARISGLLRNMQPDDAVYGVLPMSHIVGLSIILVSTLMYGATVIPVPKYVPAQLARAIEDGSTTIVYGVPATYQSLLASRPAGAPRIGRGRVRLMGVAGAPLDLTLKGRVEREFDLPLLNGYGITECSPGISGVRSSSGGCEDESVGEILPGLETRIVRTDGARAAAGEIGELQVRGPNVMLGYYRAPDLTRAAIDPDGWFLTGDLARFSGARLYIVGRVKEMIIRSGFNVYPAEIEGVINEDPRVLQSAVVGRAVEGNEEVIAFVQLAPGATATPQQLEQAVAPKLTAYKRPARFVILDAFPAGSTGKILKNKLKDQARDL